MNLGDAWLGLLLLALLGLALTLPERHGAAATEAEARAALRAFMGVGNVEPWIAQQAWEATPSGWTVAVPLDGWIFRLAVVPEGVRITASAGEGSPAVWTVPPPTRQGGT
jgi:hypothetical protein